MLIIKRWNETFETADTRKRQRLGWFMNPSGCESSGYIELMSHGTQGIIAFGVFQAICQWSATNRQEIRGQLARSDGSALNVRQVAAFIRMPPDIVENAIRLLSSSYVGWIIDKDAKNIEDIDICQLSAANLPETADNLPLVAGGLPVLCKDKDKDKEKEKEREKVDAVAVQDEDIHETILHEFNAAFKLQCRMTAPRRKTLNVRLKDEWWSKNWRLAIEKGSRSEFLTGKNERGWKIDFEFFLKPETVTKIMEGKYSTVQTKKPRLPDYNTPSGKAELEKMFLDGLHS